MFKECITEEIIEMINNFSEIKQDEEGITVKIANRKTTLGDLKQNLISKLNDNVGNIGLYKNEVELLKIILEHENKSNINQKQHIYVKDKTI